MGVQLSRLHIERVLAKAGHPSSDFDLNTNIELPKAPLKAAGVLLPLIERASGTNLILTKRSATIRNHPGQIAFPGGRVDPGDRDHVAAAIREADEEIGLPPHTVDVLGELPSHVTISNYEMHPVVGWVRQDFTPQAEEAEVSEIFEVPLRHVLDLSKYKVQSRFWRDQKRSFYTVPFGPYYIWGATARVLRSFAEKANK
ncbi:8-oxo-dGTP pyrophosphatase MutT (NUDIX family) [Pacificibacter maritimus]|uniref:8-oxo-dGTP pyrophosphatase MutT (NUDIX family) n=1 Tax=Pacificibacter maritimus TaxID=762213 RepID=A0A3N4UHS7_9RHOB|nr:CoA pyrophosphatase [Pacificibacter maritimus]RPE64697.1 8-oxo-dGTP pyrophosphatase MutT (NUDIX family) [Pacificibacter maritimus]